MIKTTILVVGLLICDDSFADLKNLKNYIKHKKFVIKCI